MREEDYRGRMRLEIKRAVEKAVEKTVEKAVEKTANKVLVDIAKKMIAAKQSNNQIKELTELEDEVIERLRNIE